ncbi:Hypothetical predicted protein, partial [Paramuricea clavata]
EVARVRPLGSSDGIGECRKSEKSSKPQHKIINARDKKPSKVVSMGRFLLQLPWSNLFSTLQSCEEKLKLFTELINLGLDIIMPKLPVKVMIDRPWLSAQLKGLITHRQKALASNNESLYKILRNKVNRGRSAYYESKVKDLGDTKPRD